MEKIEKRQDWSIVITRTEEVVITDPLQQFMFIRSEYEAAKKQVKKNRIIMKEKEEEMLTYAKAAWLLIGNVTEDGKKKRLHKLDLDSEIEFDDERGDQIFLFEDDAKVAWFETKAKKEKSEESVEETDQKE